MTEQMRLKDLLSEWESGDGHAWEVEFAWLWEDYPDKMEDLYHSINTYGFEEPILLGTDGRVWDGHHRLAVADELGVEFIPVRHAMVVEEI